MTRTFDELVQRAMRQPGRRAIIDRSECLQATRQHYHDRYAEIRRLHDDGDAGTDVVRLLTEAADKVVRGVLAFGLAPLRSRGALMSRVALCALGGYGRGELNPHSDLDICLLYEGALDEDIRTLSNYMVPFLWDAGFKVGASIRSLEESLAIAEEDGQAFTGLLEGRLLSGDSTAFARMKLMLRDLCHGERAEAYVQRKVNERSTELTDQYRDLYHDEPNVKENAGGLRDFHTALWLFMMAYDISTLDEAAQRGLISEDEHLEFEESVGFIWRIRNELHFNAAKAHDTLDFHSQRHVARAFGYGSAHRPDPAGLMSEYYSAANKLRGLLRIAARICNSPAAPTLASEAQPSQRDFAIKNGYIFAGPGDENWFAHSPPRLMEILWRCARHMVSLSRPTERLITEHLHLVNDTFRSSEYVRRFFVAICSRPGQAGHAMRQADRCGLLGRYLPEFADVREVIRYEDFHSYPVGEHTLRAIEALGQIEDMEGPVGGCLREALDNLTDPHVLVMALLFHDLGKVQGDVHVEESTRLTHAICERMGMAPDDTERIAFLVEHHVLMTNISQYRDVDDQHIVQTFADTMKTEHRLRALFLLSYADLRAVGPSVWNDWKGTLLMQLYLRAMKHLFGRSEAVEEKFWKSPKTDRVCEEVRDDLRDQVEDHIKGLGPRYYITYRPEEIAAHVECIERAQKEGLALLSSTNEFTRMTSVVICTKDRPGLFAQIAGSFSSHLVDVNTAALFTRSDGYVVDRFLATDARRRAPLTEPQLAGIEETLRAVLLRGEDIRALVEQSRRRLFALLRPRVPVESRVTFDNHSAQHHTVIDVETGDRTGLLYDIAQAIAEAGLDISTARIVTDVRRVRDSFYVTRDHAKIEDVELQDKIRAGLVSAIHPKAAAEPDQGGIQ